MTVHHLLHPRSAITVLRPERWRLFCAAAILVGLCIGHQARACDILVGSSITDCDFTDLQVALKTAEGTPQAETVCVATSAATSGLQIELQNFNDGAGGTLHLMGGHPTCASFGSGLPSGQTTISGNGTGPVFEVHGTSGGSVVTFDFLIITGGSDGLLLGDGSEVDLTRTTVTGNARGAHVTEGSTLTVDSFSAIHDNSGLDPGAGIWCEGSNVVLAGQLTDNLSDGRGGGMAADGCHVELANGARITGNSATRGGGLDLTNGTVGRGGGRGPASNGLGVFISDNQAVGFAGLIQEGGGIFAGDDVDVLFANVWLQENVADERGGAISVNGNSNTTVQIERYNFEPCLDPPQCAVVSDNRVLAGEDGRAVYVAGGGEFRMYQGFMERNTGTTLGGYMLTATGAGSRIYLEGIEIDANRTMALFDARDGASIEARFVTAISNLFQDGDPGFRATHAGSVSGGAQLAVRSSLLLDHQEFLVSGGGTIAVDCVMAETLAGATSATRSTTAVDLYSIIVNDGSRWTVRPDSPSIDYCDATFPPVDRDYDVDLRGFDTASSPNLHGTYDLGADERLILFADGFESGDTSAWSSP